VVDPPVQCWPDIKILNELGKLITPRKYWYEDYNELLDSLLAPAGLDFSQLVESGLLRGEDQFKKYEKSGFKTPSGKVELSLSQSSKLMVSALPEFNGYPEPEDDAYPLVLTSAKSRYHLHSSYRWLEKLRDRRPHPRTLIHPQTAAENGIDEGDDVTIETAQGQIIQVAHLSDGIHPKVIYADCGWWFPEDETEALFGWDRSNFNLLTTTENLGPQFGTPNLKGINCRIRPSKIV
jgi:anaerobic selenocysteine-containing dehydrogenase